MVRQPNQQFTTFPWPTNFSPNAPVNQWPVPPNIPYFYGHPLTHPHLTIPPQNSYNFPALPQTTAALTSQNIPTDELNPAQTLSVPAENEENGKNSPTSDIITNLKEWVIVDFERDGTFRIAGHHLESGQLHSSGKIVFVNNQGNLVSDGQQTLLLHGPIAWRLYEVQFPGVKINPNPQLKQAFSNAFPKIDRKRWISKLFDFLEQISSKASASRNGIDGYQMFASPLSLMRKKSENSFEGRLVNEFSYVDEDETIPSITMLEEENHGSSVNDVSSDESERFLAKSRRERSRRRLHPKLVDVGVQTLPQKPPERPKMVSRSTSTRNERKTSPITDWMRCGCQLDRILQVAYPEESTQYRSIGSPLVTDESGPSSHLVNRPPREASNSKSSHHAPRRSLRLFPSSNIEDTSRRKSSRISHTKSKSTTPISNSSSSISNISCAYLKETFPLCKQFGITKAMKVISNLDDKHTLITQNGIMDVRDLRRTRSGRLSIPTRDTLHHQKIVCNGNDISVSHGEFGKYFSSQLDD
nr:conserved hypothetical protein [Hymenolepis microstoma]